MIADLAAVIVFLLVVAAVGYGLYTLVRKLREVRQPDDDYDERIAGMGDYPFDLEPEETVLFDSRGRDIDWMILLFIGAAIVVGSLLTIILAFGVYWGGLLMVYANTRRQDSEFIFTTDRLFEIERSGSTHEYSYEEVEQIQTGATSYEKLLNTGHLEFATGEARRLNRVVAVRNPSSIGRRLEEGIAR